METPILKIIKTFGTIILSLKTLHLKTLKRNIKRENIIYCSEPKLPLETFTVASVSLMRKPRPRKMNVVEVSPMNRGEPVPGLGVWAGQCAARPAFNLLWCCLVSAAGQGLISARGYSFLKPSICQNFKKQRYLGKIIWSLLSSWTLS